MYVDGKWHPTDICYYDIARNTEYLFPENHLRTDINKQKTNFTKELLVPESTKQQRQPVFPVAITANYILNLNSLIFSNTTCVGSIDFFLFSSICSTSSSFRTIIILSSSIHIFLRCASVFEFPPLRENIIPNKPAAFFLNNVQLAINHPLKLNLLNF